MQNGMEIQDGALWVQDKRITYVGPETGEVMPEFDREIDAGQNLIMPGFKDAHTHSGMTFLRSYADDLPLLSWLNKKVFPAEAKLTAEDIYELTKLAVLEYLTSGITAIFDMYLTPESIAKACEDTGMRCVQVGALNNFSQSVELVEEMYLKLNQEDSLNNYMLGFHAEYTNSRELMEKISNLAHKYEAPVYVHNSESLSEVQQCMERTGMTPTQYMDSIGLFDCGGGTYHCVHVTDEDIEIFKKRNLSVITNPSSNAKLASGVAPISKFLKAGINVAIGTDGPASNNCLDMFREMFLVTALAKLKEDDASAMDANEVLKMATLGGAKAMGLKDSDILAVGKYADLIMIDLNQPNMQPINNITKNIVYSGSKSNVKMTMINGKILFEDGVFHIGEDETSIYQKANDIIGRIREELNDGNCI